MKEKDNSKTISRRRFLKTSVFVGASASLAAAAPGVLAMNSLKRGWSTTDQFDTIIGNGLVYNGEIKAPVKADVGIRGGRIRAIGNLDRKSTRLNSSH